MPCRGCRDKVEVEGLFKMRFVGRPNGKLMKGAPGNYEHGKTYDVPYDFAQWPFWVLLEKKPELKIPGASPDESALEEVPFISDEAEPPIEEQEPELIIEKLAETSESESNEFKRHMEEVIKADAKRGLYHIDVDEGVESIIPEPEEKTTLSREELKAVLDKNGVKYSPRARTETLAKLVEELPE